MELSFERCFIGIVSCLPAIFLIVSQITFGLVDGLVSLFNGISTFVGYLMPKPFSEKNSSGTI